MRQWLWSLLIALGQLTTAIPAGAQGQAYSFSAVHPVYGTIGTFTQSITRGDGVTRIDSRLRVAVRILGIVFHREQGDYTEIFRDDRLVSLQGATITNGVRVDLHGEAQGERFMVTSPTGVVEAPADVVPSNPWLLKEIGVGTVVSVKTGHIIPTRVTGGEPVTISVQGVTVATRHFTAQGERQQETWLNDRDVPIMFRSTENGTPIDFILTSPVGDAAIAEAQRAPTANVRPDWVR